MRLVFIVGNGPIGADFSAQVDSADHVVRFNIANLDDGKSGTKTDSLYLANSRKCLRQFLQNGRLESTAAFRGCKEIVLPKHPIALRTHIHRRSSVLSRVLGRNRDLNDVAARSFGRLGKQVSIRSYDFFADCCANLGLATENRMAVYPSTGFFAICDAILLFPEADAVLNVIGFSWGGSTRHPWDLERQWMMTQPRLIFPDHQKTF